MFYFRFLENDVMHDVEYPSDIDRYSVHYEPLNTILQYYIDQPGHVEQVEPGINFMFSRDPYSRVWSAYLDKLYLPDFWHLGRDVAKETRDSTYMTSKTCGYDVTFEELIKYIYNHRNDVKLNEHFNTVTFNCNPCKLKYDVTGRSETFASDTDLILANVGLLGEIKENQGRDRVTEEVKMLIDYNFDIPDFIIKVFRLPAYCFDNFDIARRLWRVFQLNGYIGETMAFPEDTVKMAKSRSEYKAVLKQMVFDCRKGVDTNTLSVWKSQRTRSMQGAYRLLPEELLQKFQTVYEIDFEMFQYEKRPSWLKER